MLISHREAAPQVGGEQSPLHIRFAMKVQSTGHACFSRNNNNPNNNKSTRVGPASNRLREQGTGRLVEAVVQPDYLVTPVRRPLLTGWGLANLNTQ